MWFSRATFYGVYCVCIWWMASKYIDGPEKLETIKILDWSFCMRIIMGNQLKATDIWAEHLQCGQRECSLLNDCACVLLGTLAPCVSHSCSICIFISYTNYNPIKIMYVCTYVCIFIFSNCWLYKICITRLHNKC